MSRAYRVVLPSFIFASLGILGCRTEDDGTGGAGGSSSATMSTGTKGTTTTTGNMSTTGSNTMSSTGTGQVGCNGDEHTISDITSNVVGKGTKVTVKGAVAMSQIFGVSLGDSCLWGVFVSAPGLSETGENTGILALSYGSPPMIPPGGGTDAFCPLVGQAPLGSAFPDDLKPGDVLDLVGVADEFGGTNPPAPVGQKQLSQVCSATRTGTAPVPPPHVFTSAELADAVETDVASEAFHDKWGGVKVRIEDATMTAINDKEMTLTAGTPATTFIDNRRAWYRQLTNNVQCHGNDLNYMTGQMFDRVDGFHYLSFGVWGITSGDRCGDFSPSSMACMTAGTTTCADVP